MADGGWLMADGGEQATLKSTKPQ